MSYILYYSNYCSHCKDLLYKLSKTGVKNDIHFLCIDKRKINKDGTINIIMENGGETLLYPEVKEVPSLLLVNHGNRLILGKNIFGYFTELIKKKNKPSIVVEKEPQAFSLDDQGTVKSDNYSFVDMTSDDLSAKGDGGTRQIYNYALLSDNIKIETPPETYVPDKVKNMDYNKYIENRAELK